MSWASISPPNEPNVPAENAIEHRDSGNSADDLTGASSSSIGRQVSSNQQIQCWVCFATEEDDPDTEWVQPCRCRGSTMWAHQKCLQRWVDEKQRGNTFAAVACGSCGFVYVIDYPPADIALILLEKVDRLIAKVCPLMTGGIIVMSLYWTAVTYGAVTFMQVVGWERALEVMERSDPLLVLLGLPIIPIFLITVKMIRWEDKVVAWLRDRYVVGVGRRLPVPNDAALEPAPAGHNHQPDQQQVIRDAVSATRVLCGALALPTIAVVVGNLVFGRSMAPWKRAFCGAAAFMAVRGASKIYYKYRQILRQKNRKILDHTPDVVAQREEVQAVNGIESRHVVEEGGQEQENVQ